MSNVIPFRRSDNDCNQKTLTRAQKLRALSELNRMLADCYAAMAAAEAVSDGPDFDEAVK